MGVTPINGSASISTTEYFLASASTTQTPQTTACQLVVVIDPTANVIAGDNFRVRVYETINATQRVIYEYPINGVTPVIVFPPLLVCNGWEVSLLKTAGSARTIHWTLYKLIPDTVTLGANAITSSVIADNAFTAAKFATDALNANALAADAVAEIQSGRATATALTTAQTDLTTLIGRLTSTRAGLLDNLDAAVTSRAAATTAVSNVNLTPTRAALLDNLDAAVSSRATSASIAALATAAAVAALPTAAAVAAVQTDTTTLTGRLTSIRAGLIDNLDAAMSTRAAASTALSTAQWTNARAGYLDNVNVSGPVASSAEVVAIQNNTRVVRVVPDVIERPDAGTTTYRVELLLYDAVGNMEAPDAAPTIALVNQAGTDLSARLDSATMALVSTGRYRAVYTADVSDALEQLVWTFSVVEGGATRLYGNTSVVVDTSAVDFTAADRTKLTTLAADLTTARATKLDQLDQLDAAVSSLATSAAVAALPGVAAIQAGLATSAAVAALPGVAAIQSGLATSAAVAALPTAASIAALPTTTALAAVQADTTALVTRLTAPRAANLDKLDVTVSTLATAAAVAALPTTGDIAGLAADIAGIATSATLGDDSITAATLAADAVTKLQAGLATGGAVAAIGTAVSAVSTLVTAVAADTASRVLSSAIETGINVTGALRLLLSEAIGNVTGRISNTPRFMSADNTKVRIVGTTTTDGRATTTVDPT